MIIRGKEKGKRKREKGKHFPVNLYFSKFCRTPPSPCCRGFYLPVTLPRFRNRVIIRGIFCPRLPNITFVQKVIFRIFRQPPCFQAIPDSSLIPGDSLHNIQRSTVLPWLSRSLSLSHLKTNLEQHLEATRQPSYLQHFKYIIKSHIIWVKILYNPLFIGVLPSFQKIIDFLAFSKTSQYHYQPTKEKEILYLTAFYGFQPG